MSEKHNFRVTPLENGRFYVDVMMSKNTESAGKNWSSFSKQWSSVFVPMGSHETADAPSGWGDEYWAAVDRALEAIKNFDKTYNGEIK